MFPVLVGAAVIGGITYHALSNDDDNEQWYKGYEKISESELPPDILRKLKNSSRQFNEEFLLESDVPEVHEISESRIPPDILRKLKRQ